MFAHKFRRTFLAMFWGWVAFLLVLPGLALILTLMKDSPLNNVAATWVSFAVFSLPVILVAWLFILLPVDCLVPESSRLREPWRAALLGALFGMMPFFLLGTYDRMDSLASWWAEVRKSAVDPGAWLFMGGAAIVGFTAALHIALRGTREISLATKPLKKRPFE